MSNLYYLTIAQEYVAGLRNLIIHAFTEGGNNNELTYYIH